MTSANTGTMDEIYGEGFLHRLTRKYWKPVAATGAALGLVGVGFLASEYKGHRMNGEELNMALNGVPAQARVIERPATTHMPTTSAPQASVPKPEANMQRTGAEMANAQVPQAPASQIDERAKTTYAGAMVPPPTFVSKTKYVDGDPARLKEYFGLTEDRLKRDGIPAYRFNIVDVWGDGSSKEIGLEVISNGKWTRVSGPDGHSPHIKYHGK